jgi:restriction system protein
MHLSFIDISTQMLKQFWDHKDLFLMVGVLFLIIIAFKLSPKLLSKKSRIRWFLSQREIQDLQKLSPTQFELYIAELFSSLGYKTKTVGGRGDGGIDVEAEKDGIIHYIQCKKYITRQVPVGAVRDFYGAIVDKLQGGKGYFITTHTFTLDAERFAEDKPIELIDRFKLISYIRNTAAEMPAPDAVCPRCGSQLVERNGKFGKFLGCSNYPKCTHTASYKQ